MAKINRFEDLEAYQAAMDLAEAVYTLIRNPPLQNDRSLSEQLRRAAISVPSNIAEGYERNGNREFINFLLIAKGSLGEIRCQLQLAERLALVSQDEIQPAMQTTLRCASLVAGLIRYLRNQPHNGLRDKPVLPVKPSTLNVKRQNAFALISVLLVLAVLVIMATAFMQSMRIDRLTARAYLNKVRAEMAAEAGLAVAVRNLQAGVAGLRYSTGYAATANGRDLSRPILQHYGASGNLTGLLPLYSSPDDLAATGRKMPFQISPAQKIVVEAFEIRTRPLTEADIPPRNHLIQFGFWTGESSAKQPAHKARGNDRSFAATVAELPLLASDATAFSQKLYDQLASFDHVLATRNQTIDEALPSIGSINQLLGGSRPLLTATDHAFSSPTPLLSPEGYPRLNLKQLKDYIDGGLTEYEGFPESDGGYEGIEPTQGPLSPRVRLIDELLDLNDTTPDNENDAYGYFVRKPWGHGSLKWLKKKYDRGAGLTDLKDRYREARQIVANLIDYIDEDHIPTTDTEAGNLNPPNNNSPGSNNIITPATIPTILGQEMWVENGQIQGHPMFNYLGSGIIANAGGNHINSTRILAYTVLVNPYELFSKTWTSFYRIEIQLRASGIASWNGSGRGATAESVFWRGWLSQQTDRSINGSDDDKIAPKSAYLYPRGDGKTDDLANGFNRIPNLKEADGYGIDNVKINQFTFKPEVARIIYLESSSRYVVQDISALRNMPKLWQNGTFFKDTKTTQITKLGGGGPVLEDYWLQGDPRCNHLENNWHLYAGSQGASWTSHPVPAVRYKVGLDEPTVDGSDGAQGATNSYEWWKNAEGIAHHFPTFAQGAYPSPKTHDENGQPLPEPEPPMKSLAELGFLSTGRPWQTLRLHDSASTPGLEDWRLLQYVHLGNNLMNQDPNRPRVVKLSNPYAKPDKPDYPMNYLQIADGLVNPNTANPLTLRALLRGMPDPLGGGPLPEGKTDTLARAILQYDPSPGGNEDIMPWFGQIMKVPDFSSFSDLDFARERLLGEFSNALTTQPMHFSIYVTGESGYKTNRGPVIQGRATLSADIEITLVPDSDGKPTPRYTLKHKEIL